MPARAQPTRFSPDDRTGAKDVVVVGFREDAEPFSYQVTIDGQPQFVGYLADLCYGLFQGSAYRVVSVPVRATDRFARLRDPGDPPFDPSKRAYFGVDDPRNQPVDLLCDPNTLRLERTAQIANGIYSPIVFVSGVSYIQNKASSAPSRDVMLGYVANTTAATVAQRACTSNTFRISSGSDGSGMACPPAPDQATREEIDRAACDSLVESSTDTGSYRFCAFTTHADLVRWLCRSVLDIPRDATEARAASDTRKGREHFPPAPIVTPGPDRIYFGDRDIILAKLTGWLAGNSACGSIDNTATDIDAQRKRDSYTYEPYALVVTKTNPELFQHVQRRIYEFFSHRSEASALFDTYFPGQGMSEPLAYLFLLNGVAEESMFKRSDAGAADR